MLFASVFGVPHLKLFYYHGYSLHIASEMPLPELPEMAQTDRPDVLIRLGDVPRTPENATLRNELAIHNFAGAFLINDGNEIVVDPLPTADPRVVRLILLGRMMAYLLRQRGWLPLHASGVMVGDGAVLFLGYSGAGKSSAAAAFCAKGYRLMTDDIAPVKVRDERCIALPARPRLRLDVNSCPLLASKTDHLTREWDGKYVFELPRISVPAYVDVQRIYILKDGDRMESRTLSAIQSVPFLSAHCFFRRRRMDSAAVEAHVRDCAAVAQKSSIRVLVRPRQLSALSDLVRFVESDFASN